MESISGARQLYEFWQKDSPLNGLEKISKFGHFVCYDGVDQQWQPINTWKAILSNNNARYNLHNSPVSMSSNVTLVTWNINSGSPIPEARLNSILTSILAIQPAVDIVCFQEVSRLAHTWLMADERIRNGWFCTRIESADWGKSKFVTVTLLNKCRFVCHGQDVTPEQLVLGRTWRTRYESRFERDALCCDVFGFGKRLRLINVHLDSLPITPSCRPGQVSTAAQLLKSAGGGLVAGDFNPLFPEDKEDVSKYGLVDAWLDKRADESGFTWGHSQTEFPPGRFDKVLVSGLEVSGIRLIEPASVLMSTVVEGAALDPTVESMRERDCLEGEVVDSSDHWGVWCSLEIPEPS